MKKIIGVFLFLFILGCQKEGDVSREKLKEKEEIARQEKIKKKGEEIANQLLKKLKKELVQAMREKGAAGAVSVCSIKALPLTEEVSQKAKSSIKRTSFKVRNPKNQPDKWEKEALEFFQKHWPKRMTYVQEIEKEGKKKYRFYKALKIQPLCLTCHGKVSQIPKEVQKILKEKYPKDRATGYQLGDFRGVIRVEME